MSTAACGSDCTLGSLALGLPWLEAGLLGGLLGILSAWLLARPSFRDQSDRIVDSSYDQALAELDPAKDPGDEKVARVLGRLKASAEADAKRFRPIDARDLRFGLLVLGAAFTLRPLELLLCGILAC